MTSTTAPPRRRPSLWVALVHVVLDLPAGIITFCVVLPLLVLSVALLPLFLLGIPLLFATFGIVRGLAVMERGRYAAVLGERIAAPHRTRRGGWRARFRTDLRSGDEWRQVGYSLLLLFTGAIGSSLVLGAWSAGPVLATLPLWGQLLPDGDPLLAEGWAPTLAWTVLGIALVAIAPAVTRGWVALDLAMARKLLGPSDTAALTERVEVLTQTRREAVEAADAERRRIERDLHDGAQQRLVALAMSLGRARLKLEDDPKAAGELVREAHDDAKTALAELRDLARGLHPAVLTDRGLDAALSGAAARSPVPVQLQVEVAQRPDTPVEAAAYFVVSEALANIAKHAQAAKASVTVRRQGSVLRVVVEDDGRGGADPGKGSGLAGLAARVAAADGRMWLSSPAGGPTILEVELPCA